jgi:hypothetical protein
VDYVLTVAPMPTYSPQTASFADIAATLPARIAAAIVPDPDTDTPLDPAYVRLVASDSYVVNVMEPAFVFVRYYGPQPFTDAGAGRRAMPVVRLVRTYIYTRNGSDVSGSDVIALTAADIGHARREEAVYAALVNWFPADAEGLPLTIEPLHPVDSAGGPPERRPEAEEGLVRSHLDFEVRYLLKIDVTDPAA